MIVQMRKEKTMLKKTITYTDYDGNERTEDFFFNLNRAELTEMEMSVNGGLTKLIEKIVQESDQSKIITYFKELILRSYGQKSLDGKRFVKSEELSKEFSQTEAYSELFMELASDAKAAAAFVNAIVPQSVSEVDTVSNEKQIESAQSN